MSRRRVTARGLRFASLVFLAVGCARSAEPPRGLAVLGEAYPRVFFFRGSESGSSRKGMAYEQWAPEFSRLMGIMGKCLDEEVLGRERLNPEWFSRFKREYPEQAVLLHFNGNARDPRYGTEKYFAGHWIYRQATVVAEDVPAEEGESEIRVEDASDFRTESGRYRTSNDDLALFGLTADGKHDWSRCEQAQLVSVDVKANVIRVRRGCYGTRPLAFKKGAARVAAHETEGPWGKTNNLLWFYNFSEHCPKDAEGKSCSDRLADDLAAWFGKGGKLESFDGLEFDVMFNETQGDTDGDGVADNGVVNGVNGYGIGMIRFAAKLRERLGPRRIIQGDGALGQGGARSQRAFGHLNGIESEGWPNLNDWEMDDWSGGLNRHLFWNANACAPAFSYINHKWVQPVEGKPGEHQDAEVPFARHRLVFAAAQLMDAALTFAYAPPRARGAPLAIWDEFVCGTEGRLGWLGKPLGPAARLAETAPEGIGLPAGEALSRRISGAVRARATGAGIEIVPTDASATECVFTVTDVPVGGSDVTVFATLSGEPLCGYPADMARWAEVELSGGAVALMERRPQGVGMTLRGKAEAPLDERTGARVAFQPNVRIGDIVLPAYAIHPPFKAVKGSVHWQCEAAIPQGAELRFHLGMSEKAPQRSDGVWFSVRVAELEGSEAGAFEQVFESSTKAFRWLPQTVPLEKWAGKRVRLKFTADCGPENHATTDQGYWGDVKIVSGGRPETEITPACSRMTWVNRKPFDSTFFYSGVCSKRIDLRFRVEGKEAVTLQSLRVHASPDARYRVFEHGLVLANPGRSPYGFDLSTCAPGRAFRRIRATALQDTKANTGEPVGPVVTLGPLEGLFLAEVPRAP